MGNWGTMSEPRRGVMLHYTAGSFAGSVAWCRNPDSRVSYHAIVGQRGDVELLAPWDRRAWHAGVCQSSDPRLPYKDANSAFEGVALAAGPGMRVTPEAFDTIVRIVRLRFRANGWDDAE